MNSQSVVIIGSGQGGFQASHSLRQSGFEGVINLIGDEPHLPYQRPPLSKAFMLGAQDEDGLLLRQPDFYKEHNIDLHMGRRATIIDIQKKQVHLNTGEMLDYNQLVFATGTRVRKLDIAGANLDGVVYVRTLDDAKAIKARLSTLQNIVVIGGGFIGLEFAAVARKWGKNVTVLEAQSRLMARAVAPVMSNFFEVKHREHGVVFEFNCSVAKLVGEAGKVCAVLLADKRQILADLVVVGIGVIANDELARDAGLECQNGIVVDEHLRTSDSSIYAIGDCVQHYNVFANRMMRVESVQNAVDQARCVAAQIMGSTAGYCSVPWFWSDQYDLKLQMVGISTGYDEAVVRGDPRSYKFSVFHYVKGQLTGIDSVNRPADHMLGRKLIAQGLSVPPDVAGDENANLKLYMQSSI